jgi:hypothetical protein
MPARSGGSSYPRPRARGEHLDKEANHGRVKLPALLTLGRSELAEEILVVPADDVFRAVLRIAQSDCPDEVDELTEAPLAEACAQDGA